MMRVRTEHSTLALALALVGLAGCAENPVSLIIRQNNAPGEGCVIPAEVSSEYLSSGFLDVGGVEGLPTLGYLFTPAVASGLTPGEADTENVIILKGARVELVSTGAQNSTDAISVLKNSDTTSDRATVFASGSVAPGSSTGMAFEIIDSEQVLELRDFLTDKPFTSVQILARVVVFGTVEGRDIESPVFTYPVTACLGCVYYSLGDCSTVPDNFTPSVGGVCNPLQDGQLHCCTLNGLDICPAQSVTAAELSMTPGSFNFDAVAAGASKDQVFTISNTGGGTTGMMAATIAGSGAYTKVNGMDLCSGQTLLAGASCTVVVRFTPAGVPVVTGTLTVAAAPGGSQSAALTGSGLP